MKRILVAFAVLTLIAHFSRALDEDKGANLTLDHAFRTLIKGAASDKKESRENAVRSMLPSKKDIDFLFPKQANALWPQWEKQIQEIHEKADEQAQQLARGGAVTKISILDVRQNKILAEQYKAVLDLIPQDVPVAECYYELEKGKGRMRTFFRVHGRWIVIRDLEGFMP